MNFKFYRKVLLTSVVILLFTLGYAQRFVTDLKVLEGRSTEPPAGYIRIPIDLNEGAKGKFLYFIYKRGGSKSEAIKDIIIVTGKQVNMTVPSPYERIPTDLNWGSGGDYIYAGISRNASLGQPITDISVLACSSANFGCSCAGTNSHKILTDLNKRAGGKYVFLCYIRRDNDD